MSGIKSTNYIQNAVAATEAKQQGGWIGIMCTYDNKILEAPVANVGFVFKTRNGLVFKCPCEKQFQILQGTGMKRALKVAEQLKKENILYNVQQGEITIEEAYQAEEIIIIANVKYIPVVKLNGVQIGNGTPGDIWKILKQRAIDMIIEEGNYETIPYSN